MIGHRNPWTYVGLVALTAATLVLFIRTGHGIWLWLCALLFLADLTLVVGELRRKEATK